MWKVCFCGCLLCILDCGMNRTSDRNGGRGRPTLQSCKILCNSVCSAGHFFNPWHLFSLRLSVSAGGNIFYLFLIRFDLFDYQLNKPVSVSVFFVVKLNIQRYEINGFISSQVSMDDPL